MDLINTEYGFEKKKYIYIPTEFKFLTNNS